MPDTHGSQSAERIVGGKGVDSGVLSSGVKLNGNAGVQHANLVSF